MSKPYDLDELLGEYTPIAAVRSAIKHLQSKENLSLSEQDDLAKLIVAERGLRSVYKTKAVVFVDLGNGRYGVSGRPSFEKIKQLANEGVDIFITLLKTEESGRIEIGEAVNTLNMEWIWFPLSAAQLPTDTQSLAETEALFQKLDEDLSLGKTIYVHCAAGVHRTGSFTNAFLQYRGHSPEASKAIVKSMRDVTAREAVPKHWAWATEVLAYKNRV